MTAKTKTYEDIKYGNFSAQISIHFDEFSGNKVFMTSMSYLLPNGLKQRYGYFESKFHDGKKVGFEVSISSSLFRATDSADVLDLLEMQEYFQNLMKESVGLSLEDYEIEIE